MGGINNLFRQNIPHVIENIFHNLTVIDLAKCREISRQWRDFIDNNLYARRRLYLVLNDFSENINSHIHVVNTNICFDNDIVVLDNEVQDVMDENEVVREIDIFDATTYQPMYRLGTYALPSFYCLQRMKMQHKILIIFTTSNFEDKLLTFDLVDPSAPKERNFRPAGRLPLICADADGKYDLSVYRFSPKIMNVNSLESGLLIKRIPLRREGHIVSVKIEWPRCLAIIAIEDSVSNDPVRKLAF